jgi:hypothetical protein
MLGRRFRVRLLGSKDSRHFLEFAYNLLNGFSFCWSSLGSGSGVRAGLESSKSVSIVIFRLYPTEWKSCRVIGGGNGSIDSFIGGGVRVEPTSPLFPDDPVLLFLDFLLTPPSLLDRSFSGLAKVEGNVKGSLGIFEPLSSLEDFLVSGSDGEDECLCCPGPSSFPREEARPVNLEGPKANRDGLRAFGTLEPGEIDGLGGST